MIESILPEGVHAGECFTDLPDEPLFPEEEALIAAAVDKRRREFRTVRGCARAALAELGEPRPPLIAGRLKAPEWPAGVVGAMTHCIGYRAAVVAPASRFAALGVDAEPNDPLPDGVLDVVSLPAERERLAALAPGDTSWDRLLFSAKESVYKAWSPLTGRWLGFDEAELEIDVPSRRFRVRLLADPPLVGGVPLTHLSGAWTVGSGLVVTLVAVPAP